MQQNIMERGFVVNVYLVCAMLSSSSSSSSSRHRTYATQLFSFGLFITRYRYTSQLLAQKFIDSHSILLYLAGTKVLLRAEKVLRCQRDTGTRNEELVKLHREVDLVGLESDTVHGDGCGRLNLLFIIVLSCFLPTFFVCTQFGSTFLIDSRKVWSHFPAGQLLRVVFSPL